MANRRRRSGMLRLGLTVTVMLALAVGCGSSEDSAGASATATTRFREGMEGLQGGVQRGMPAAVTMTDELRFEPAQVTVPVGTTLMWRNGSAVEHTVTADPTRAKTASTVRLPDGAGPFESENLPPNQTFTQQLTVAGEYRYVCRIHEESGMVGVITVE
jgi:plastocyanin